MTGSPRIDILLATFNGELYLAEQLDSVRAQTYGNWRLLARDDGSTDATPAILRRYAALEPERIAIVEDGPCGLGARGNFSRLMQRADADYVMFCDQDDVWLPGKIDTLLGAMRKLESETGADAPLLVHSDLRVVGPGLEELHPSFWAYQSIDPDFGKSINRLLIQNVVTGCAALCNRRLVELSRPIPPESLMHDWWLALVAVSYGRIAYVADATVLYRQHGANTLGAKRKTLLTWLLRGVRSPRRAFGRARTLIAATQEQAAAFGRCYGTRLPPPVLDSVVRFAGLGEQGFFARRRTIISYRFLTAGPLSNIVLLAAV